MSTHRHLNDCSKKHSLFIIVSNWKQAYIHQLMKGYVYLYIHTYEYCSQIKNKDTCYNMDGIQKHFAK